MNADSNQTPDETPTANTVALQARVDQLEQQVSDYKLLVADFDNSRRRLTQDADRQRKYATEPLAKDLLTALDNLDRAVEAAKAAGEAGPLAQGVTATIALFLDIFKRHGVARIEVAPGSAFDPTVHQAVMQQPSPTYPPGSVVQVLQQGFRLHDRVIRPASVIVAADA